MRKETKSRIQVDAKAIGQIPDQDLLSDYRKTFHCETG